MIEPHITTFSGLIVNPLALVESDLNIEDIAHHLSQINRFCGALRAPVNVAQHSVYVSRLCAGTPYELQGLLHDASEAYLGDVTYFLKRSPTFAGYREIETRAQRTIFRRFGCAEDMAQVVLDADRLMVRYEAERMGHPLHSSFEPITPAESDRVGSWHPWSWTLAKEEFLFRFKTLIS